MKQIKPEDRPKLIGLLVACGLVLVYFGLVVVPKLSQAQAPPPPPPPAPGAVATAQPATAAMPQVDETVAIVGPAGRDPFTPPVRDAVPASPTAAPTPAPSTPQSLLGRAPVPPVAPVAPPPVTLQGVLPGSPAIAVLRINAQTLERIPGQLIAPGIALDAVTDGGATLRFHGRQVSVSVGHTAFGAETEKDAGATDLRAKPALGLPTPPLREVTPPDSYPALP